MFNSESDSKDKKKSLTSNGELSLEKWVLDRVNKAIDKFDEEKRLEQFRRRKEDRLVEKLREISINRLDKDDFFHNYTEEKKDDEHKIKRYKNENHRVKRNILIKREFILQMIFICLTVALVLYPRLNGFFLDFHGWYPEFNSFFNSQVDFVSVVILFLIIGIVIFRAKFQSEKPISNKYIYIYFLNLILFFGYLSIGSSLYFLWFGDYSDSNGTFDQIIFFSQLLILPILSIWYWVYSNRMIPVLDKMDMEIRNKVSEIDKKIKSCEGMIDELTSNIVEDVRVQLEQDYDLIKLDDYDTKVPRYLSQRTFRKVGERHDEYEPTEELLSLTNYITEMDKGSFGIAGVRGFGKTALMKALEKNLEGKNSNNYVTVWLSAPTAINEETFLLSVLAKLATCVGTKLTQNQCWPDDPPEIKIQQEKRNRIAKFILCIIPVLLISIGGLAFFPEYKNGLTPISEVLSFIVLLIVVFLLCAFLIKRFRGFYRRSTLRHETLIFASTEMLENLWFQHKKSESNQALLTHYGVQLGSSSGTEKTRQPFTLPHLIQMWDNFVQLVTTSGNFRKVVIFIDEIDKISGTEKIGEFMRILKALYIPMNLFFIVSISEDAYDRFQKRTSPSMERDEFDSCFDHIIHIEEMKFDEIKEVLDNRILGYKLSIPITLLIWMLSRGNPRDAIRITRDVCMKYQEKDISLLTRKLCLVQLNTCHDINQVIFKSNGLNFEELNLQIPRSDDNNTVIQYLLKYVQKISSSQEDPDYIFKLYIAEMVYIITVFEFFSKEPIKRSRELYEGPEEKDGDKKPLELFLDVQKRLSTGAASQTLAELNSFRGRFKLERIDLIS